MLPFTAEILFASMTQYNQALWPLPPVALLLGLAAVLLAVRPVRDSNRLISGYLAAAWLWVGIVYHMLHFARLDFAAPLYGGLFVLEGLLLLWTAVQDKVAFRFHGGPIGWVGLALAMLAVAWPLVDRLSGLAWQAERVVGLAPAPTTILTLALLLLADRRAPPYLAIIPLLWTLIAGAIAWILWIPQDLMLPVVGLGGFALILWKNRCYAVSRSRARRAG